MKKRVFSVLSVLFNFIAFIFFVYPQSDSESQNVSVISSIKIEGLVRTHEFVIQRELKSFIGKEASDETLHEIETVMQMQGLFNNISVQIAPPDDGAARENSSDGVIVKITLEEKISVLPLPIAMVSDGNVSGGFFLFDSNALGMKNTFVLGGMISSDSLIGMTMYSKPPAGHIPGFSVSMSVENDDSEICDIHDDDVYDFKAFSFDVMGALQEKITDFLTFQIETGFRMTDMDSDDEIEGAIESVKVWQSGAGFLVRFSDWNGVFMSEKGFQVKMNVDLTMQNDFFNCVEASEIFQFSLPSLPRLRLVHSASASYGYDTPIVFYKGGRSAAVSLFPDDFLSERLAGCSTGLEYAVFQTKYGIISLYGVYQAAIAKDFDDDYHFNHGAGGGMKVYLSKIAFPACAVEVIYNISENDLGYGFSLGVAF